MVVRATVVNIRQETEIDIVSTTQSPVRSRKSKNNMNSKEVQDNLQKKTMKFIDKFEATFADVPFVYDFMIKIIS